MQCDQKVRKTKKKRRTYRVCERLRRWNGRSVWNKNCSKVLNKDYCVFQITKTGSLHGNDLSKPAGVFVCTNFEISVWHHNDSWLRHINHQKCQNISKNNYGQLWMTKKDPPEAELRYDNDRFAPYTSNSHFVTVTVTPKNRRTKDAENIRIDSIKAAAHLE